MKKYLISILLLMASTCFAQCTSKNRMDQLNDYASGPEWQPNKVIETLHIQKGWYIGDLGAGGGYYTYRFADETGETGKVFAADINKDYLIGIINTAQERDYKNIDTVLCSENDSRFLDHSLDLIFIRNTFHHLNKRNAYMKKLAGKLKPGGRIAIIDYKKDAFLFSDHNITKDNVISAIDGSKLEIANEYDFLEKQHFFILKLKNEKM